MTKTYTPIESSYQNIAELQAWNLVVHGGERSLKVEQRGRLTMAGLGKRLPTTTFLGVHRENKDNIVLEQAKARKTISVLSFTPNFQAFLAEHKITTSYVLLDITTLEMDVMLHLLHFFHNTEHQSLHALYAAPNTYTKVYRSIPRVGQIGQPPGYVSLRVDDDIDYPHIVIVGFDGGRARWFFDSYSRWNKAYRYALIGDPAHMDDGTNKARKANEWIDDIPPSNLLLVNSLEPEETKNALVDLYSRYGRLDIIPLGPKSMVLGMVLFYFSLPEAERNNIRILYDFPYALRSRTSGIGDIYLIDCSS